MQTIYAIPGLGTDKELYRNIAIPNYQLKVLDWPQPEKNLSLEEYAAKFIPQINQSEPVNLIGVSFGGMLCAELAEQIKTNKVILISSCRNSSEFPYLLKALNYFPVHKLVPDGLVRLLAKSKRRFLGFEKSFEPTFVKMIDSMPGLYFSSCIRYIISWKRSTNTANIVQIHGMLDKLLFPRKINDFYAIEKGSHSMVLNRANEINDILNKEFNGL